MLALMGLVPLQGIRNLLAEVAPLVLPKTFLWLGNSLPCQGWDAAAGGVSLQISLLL